MTWDIITMAGAPAATFSKEVSLSPEASVAQTEKKGFFTIFMEPPHQPYISLHPASLAQREVKILFRPLLFPICYWQLDANRDGSTRKLQVEGCWENGSWSAEIPPHIQYP